MSENVNGTARDKVIDAEKGIRAAPTLEKITSGPTAIVVIETGDMASGVHIQGLAGIYKSSLTLVLGRAASPREIGRTVATQGMQTIGCKCAAAAAINRDRPEPFTCMPRIHENNGNLIAIEVIGTIVACDRQCADHTVHAVAGDIVHNLIKRTVTGRLDQHDLQICSLKNVGDAIQHGGEKRIIQAAGNKGDDGRTPRLVLALRPNTQPH
ncbi:hypothetical protein NUJ38_01065 [Gluconobacter oxydans]|nr:hypothetical protein [Gluconobacter oxydans]WKE48356.1 hypothetical protein NUJ38_01065 [Gluconobacter oxydans]